MAAHTTKDGIHWVPARFKANDRVWARVLNVGSTAFFIGEGERNRGKACIKYKPTPNPTWYWVDPALLEILPEGEDSSAGGRRSKRLRGDVSAEQLAAEEEAERKVPRTAANGKLYGVAPTDESRARFKQGKDLKERCAKCSAALAGDGAYLGFIETVRERTVRKTYGGDSQRQWSGTFDYNDRDFFHIRCWEVPKAAQRSLRGLVDIAGFDSVPVDAPERAQLLARLSDVHGAAEAAAEAGTSSAP